jgi:stalled ribosome alternative rescue factor ArfA
MKRGKKVVKRRNAFAAMLRDAQFRPRVVRMKTLYSRKRKNKNNGRQCD